MSDAHTIATRLEEYLDAGYFAGAIKDIYRLINHAAFLEKKVADLKAAIARTQTEAREKNAWEGRYNALLEECEASRPRTVEGDGSDLPAGTVVIDKIGDAWRRYRLEGWVPTGDGPYDSLPESCAPYTIVYTPTPKENTND